MKFTPFVELFGGRKVKGNNRRLKKSRWAVPFLEPLEDRLAPAVIPTPNVLGQFTIDQPGTNGGNDNTPSVAIDPTNSSDLVTVFTNNNPAAPGTQKVFVNAEFSIDGGHNWSSIFASSLASNLPDPTTTNPQVIYSTASNISVAFDRSSNFYVTWVEHNAAGSAGAVMFDKFNFSGGTVTEKAPTNQVLYQWAAASAATADQALNPTIAVDNNLANFTDPTTGKSQTDPFTGNVYVAWSTINAPPTNIFTVPSFNANSIKVMASSDGGSTFTTQVYANDNLNSGSAHHTAPRLVVSQGTADGRVKPGQLTLVWDDFGTGAGGNPPFDVLTTSQVQNGGTGALAQGSTGGILDALKGSPDVPTTTPFTALVNITDPNFVVTDLDVNLTILHPAVNELSATLTAPDGTTVLLFNNHTNSDGSANNLTGVMGANLGIMNGVQVGTTFDNEAARPINDPSAVAPYTEHFRPELGFGTFKQLSFYNGMTAAQVNGTWILRITDNKNGNVGSVVNWSLNFTSGLTHQSNVAAATGVVRGAAVTPFPLIVPASPQGVSPAPVLASDNTLGSFSPYQGRLYLAYVGHQTVHNPDINPATNTDIFLVTSDDGGSNWSNPVVVNDDFAPSDGFSQAVIANKLASGRTQFEPSVAVDQSTGTVVLSFYDARYDASNARVATFIATSIDGGGSFSPETFANAPQTAVDAITGNVVVLGPIPDNQSTGNPNADPTFGFGASQSLAVSAGHIYPVWTSNRDVRTHDGIQIADATFTSGPRIISSTMGPVQSQTVDGKTFNNTFTADGIQQITGFTVTFDRPVDPSTFGVNDVAVRYRDTTTPASTPGQTVAVASVTPLDLGSFGPAGAQGATTFFIAFTTAQSGTGTYSYSVGPNISDRIRQQQGASIKLGNQMDENANGTQGENPGDVYATPRPINGVPFQLPYDQNTLPIIEPGPHVVSTHVPGAPPTADNLVLNGTVNSIDVVFDRDMIASSFTPSQVLRIIGPAGQINGPFTVTPNPNQNDPNPNFPRTFRIGFPTQQLSGTYVITFGPNIQAKNGDMMDTNLNAGMDVLRGIGATTVPVTFNSSGSASIAPATNTAPSVTSSTINVTDSFTISSLTLSLNITYPFDPDLAAFLVAPDGTTVKLFTGVGGNGTQHSNFTNTTLDDSANTPIQSNGASAPFGATYNPQTPLSALLGKGSSGTYTLVIKNFSSSRSGTLNSWSLTFKKPQPGTNLGEPVADQATATFRIFTMDSTNPLSHNTWTAVGPAANNGSGNSGRISGLAMDPSDPSGNTVFVGGASGGVWKTTNFLTTSGNGPTWIPLTDFGASFAINIGGIAVFARNNDPRQSIVFAATGEGDTGSTGVGIIRSMDGGATWSLLDSTDNTLGMAQRDHKLVGTTSFKIVTDPTALPGGQVAVYAALSGANGGIWRSLDSGNHWTQVRAGQATDVVLAVASGDPTTKNLQIVYGAIQGQGVFLSPNQGTSWFLMTGGLGANANIQDGGNPSMPVPVLNAGVNPNGVPNGRIALVAPNILTNTPADLIYEGWLYAAVESGNHLAGLYVTKDFGANWTKVSLPEKQSTDAAVSVGVPSNDNTLTTMADPFGNPNFAQGHYDMSLAIDPTNFNVVYVGGTDDGAPAGQGGIIRVDTTGIADAHSLVGFDYNDAGAGLMQGQTTGNITVKNPNNSFGLQGNTGTNYLNLIRDPFNPFGTNVIQLTNVSSFTNDGSNIKWMGFNDAVAGSTDQHRVYSMVDPTTGHARLVFADDQGIFTGVDMGNGQLITSIGTAQAVTGSRNGNLSITQFYYGAAQPSILAADAAGAYFYANTQDNGHPASDPNVITNGNIGWSGPLGDGQGVATDQTGSGTVYHYIWPCCGGSENGQDTISFFQVNGQPQTTGLILQASGGKVPDPEWPFLSPTTSNFAVNPVNNQEIVITSAVGRAFLTDTQGKLWFVIGNPADLDGANAHALAFGAPDPNQAAGTQDNFIYLGTTAGHVFVTFTAGGNGTTNQWINLSAGLDGSSVESIVTNPVRGSHQAYAVTSNGVYYMQDSSAPGATWQKITGNVFQLTEPIFSTGSQSPLARSLTSIVADWRILAPNNFQPNSPTHPVLYVGGEAGVFRSTDNGKTWTIFPGANGNIPAGGYLPVAHITHMDLSLGNINPTTGLPDQSAGENLLVAYTYGRGAFAIRLDNNLAPGPRVVGLSPKASPGAVSSIQITFAGPVDPATFNVSSIDTFRGPNGNITPLSVTPVDANHRIYQINFPTQSTNGTYTITIGPNIRDFAGNSMDQNGNGINGEVSDTFTGVFTIGPVSAPLIVTGADAGGGPEVKVYDALTHALKFDFYAYDSHFMGGVRVALADLNGDGVPEIITAPGPGGGPDIRVFDGKTGVLIHDFYAYTPAFTGGVYIAAGDVNGDGVPDIVTGADAGGGPAVQVFDGKSLNKGMVNTFIPGFYAYTPGFGGGVRVAVGDVNGDGFADIITAAGPGGGPDVEIFDGKSLATTGQPVHHGFYAYDPGFTGGVYVAAGDVSGDGKADIITGAGAGGGPHVKVFSGSDGTVLASFFAVDQHFLGGVRVGFVSDLNGDGNADILTAVGPGGGPEVDGYDGLTATRLDGFYAYNSAFTGGVFVGGR